MRALYVTVEGVIDKSHSWYHLQCSSGCGHSEHSFAWWVLCWTIFTSTGD